MSICNTCGQVIDRDSGQIDIYNPDPFERRCYHPDCLPIPVRTYEIQGLRWTLEARLLAALILRVSKDRKITITEKEMEAVKGMMFLPSKPKTFTLEVTSK